MAIFPSLDTISIISPLSLSIETKTLISFYSGAGRETRKQKWVYPKRNLRAVGYKWLTLDDANTLWQFYMDRGGAYEAFNTFLEHSDSYANEYLGTGDGATVSFNMPSKNATSELIYVDSILKTDPADYAFTAIGGTDGADKIVFVVAPSDGSIITTNFTGYLKIHSRFAEHSLEYDLFFRKLSHMGISIKGLFNA